MFFRRMSGRLAGGQIIFKRSDTGKGQCIRTDGRDSITGTGSGWKNVEAAN